ncbi:MAG: RluA family pseudouridine synthase [Planctomycetaceae bacterium]|jgi:23S rRNA pseudouridine1911/1915/1917 synthase|nr:RluA family pseudouridine synthase [Planctomycetaceae bacterium]
MPEHLNVLYEDNHLLAISKPAGIATMGLPDGEETLLTRAKRYIKERYAKPGLVYLGVASRLDFLVSGVVVFARTSKAAARLNEQFRNRNANKIYHAIVEGYVSPKESRLVNYLCEDKRHRKMWIASRSTPESKESALRYRLVKYLGNLSFLEITLETGRKHQIRLQLSHMKHPILGDVKYGSRRAFPEGIALHAKCLTLLHPITKKPITFESPYPDCWKIFIK